MHQKIVVALCSGSGKKIANWNPTATQFWWISASMMAPVTSYPVKMDTVPRARKKNYLLAFPNTPIHPFRNSTAKVTNYPTQMKLASSRNNFSSNPKVSSPNPPKLIINRTLSPPSGSNVKTSPMLISVLFSISSSTNVI